MRPTAGDPMGFRQWMAGLIDPEVRYARLAEKADPAPSTGAIEMNPGAMTRTRPGPAEAKAWNPSATMARSSLGRPYQVTWDLKSAIDDGFKSVPWVYIGIDKIARSAASVPWVAKRAVTGDADQWETASESALHALLQRPNEHQTMGHLVYRYVVGLLLGGNGLFKKVRGLGDEVLELWTLNPRAIEVVPDAEEFISHYLLKHGDGRPERHEVADIIHSLFPDPDNQYWGMGRIQAVAKTIDIEREALNFQKAGLQNRAVIGGLLSLDSTGLDKKKFAQLREILWEQVQGASNARNLLMMGNSAKFEKMSLTPEEMDFLESRRLTREEILAAIGVPPPTVGIYENATLANVETARKILWVDTVIPVLNEVRDTLNLRLAPEFGEGWRVDYDKTGVEALWPIIKERIEAAERLWKMGVPLNDLNRRFELGLGEQPGGDLGYVPANVMPSAVDRAYTLDDE